MATFPPEDIALRTEAEKGTAGSGVYDLAMRTEDEKEEGVARKLFITHPVNISGMI